MKVTVQHSSMQFSDSPAKQRHDVRVVFRYGSDIVSGTESGKTTPAWGFMTDVAHDHGYALARNEFGTWVAVKRSFGRIIDHGFIEVVPAVHRPASQGGHQPRGLFWVKIDAGELGVIFEVVGHWVTGYGSSRERTAGHTRMTQEFVDFLEHSSKGRKISFFSGDVNINEETDLGRDHGKPDWLFNRAGMTTVWDELYPRGANLPSTHGAHGGTIDIVGSVDKDRRVKALTVKVSRKRVFKDHRDVIVTYDVKPLPGSES